MFKQPNKPLPDRIPIATFLSSVALKNGFTNKIDGRTPRCMHDERLIHLNVVKVSGRERLHLEIRLVAHKSLPIYLVTKMKVDGGGYMAGHWALNHHEKRLAYENSDHNRDFENKDVSMCWVVSSASNVEALMREYDMLAELNGAPKVFNLP